jgi:anti-sigma factor RsiW
MDDNDVIRADLKISCADALELMTDLLEGALSSGDAERMRAHLEGCEACSVYLDQLKATIRIVGGTVAPEARFQVAPERLEELAALFRSKGHR